MYTILLDIFIRNNPYKYLVIGCYVVMRLIDCCFFIEIIRLIVKEILKLAKELL